VVERDKVALKGPISLETVSKEGEGGAESLVVSPGQI
jgi:hypothetical protein